jgi:hypothetical protein
LNSVEPLVVRHPYHFANPSWKFAHYHVKRKKRPNWLIAARKKEKEQKRNRNKEEERNLPEKPRRPLLKTP